MTTTKQKLLFSGYTKNGYTYQITHKGDEIIFLDSDKRTLTWEYNAKNLDSVKEMVQSIDVPKEYFTAY